MQLILVLLISVIAIILSIVAPLLMILNDNTSSIIWYADNAPFGRGFPVYLKILWHYGVLKKKPYDFQTFNFEKFKRFYDLCVSRYDKNLSRSDFTYFAIIEHCKTVFCSGIIADYLDSQYYGFNNEDIKQIWEVASNLGIVYDI